ncbi:protein NUCLEAR FUSION DEFECTIVE 4-like [Musa acuminata AAA Group]|uniref:protein NUCLEAR FUSION DEFECTIVE 4-like n=1 Tax=Musa acuminata AAA Group TaxID=214697 RepID=UPI0031D72518
MMATLISWLVSFLGFPSFDGPNSPSIPDRSETATAREGRKRIPAAAMEDGAMMGRQTRKWMVLMATVWIQAFTGTNFDFSAYSSDLKAAMGISQVQLNYLATASDLGKALGWSSGLALLYLPLPFVLLLAAAVGFGAYGAQWLLITNRISLPYFPVFLLCLLAGCSICWFNTVCFVLCVRNFPVNRSLALSLTTSFNGVSASLYTLVVNAVGGSCSVYLLLNATLPLLVSTIALLPIVRQPPTHLLLLAPADSARHDSYIFLLLNILAFITGFYLLFLNSISSVSSTARLLLVGAVLLLLLPLCVPGVICARDWARRTIFSSSLFSFIGVEDLELQKQLVQRSEDDIDVSVNNGDAFNVNDGNDDCSHGEDGRRSCWWWWCWCCDRLAALGDEHTATRLVSRIDFWLYYVSYFCAATVGLVYSNNLGQIAQSMGRQSQTTMLVTVYSSCSFFGRLVSAAPDFLRGKINFARTGWLAVAVVPMPLAFFLLAEVGDTHALLAGTALIALSSGFIFAAAVCITSELFGPNSLGVNHNILITNIPLGSLLYGLLAALIYDANGKSMVPLVLGDGMVLCMGRKCYAKTFLWWACITMVGLASSLALYLRTRAIYVQPTRRPAAEEGAQSEAQD